MIKRFLSCFFIVFGVALLYSSTSRKLMSFFKVAKDNNNWWGEFQLTKGDLLELSHLDFVNKLNNKPQNSLKEYTSSAVPPKCNLYLLGDSYIWGLSKSNFEGLFDFHSIDFYGVNSFHLDLANKNALIIEISERFIRETMDHNQVIDCFYDSVKGKEINNVSDNTCKVTCKEQCILDYFSSITLFNKYINQNLEFNLFTYNFMLPLFETKASINYYLFGRASGDAIISDDGNFLFLKETAVDYGPKSSFSKITGKEISNIIHHLNAMNNYYKSSGFSKIYLSIIPNPITIIQPTGYNNLIPLIQNDPHLSMSVIDIYSIFKNNPDIYYLPGDTHWNNKGKQLWVDLVNKTLRN